jgi:hypothetical protein
VIGVAQLVRQDRKVGPPFGPLLAVGGDVAEHEDPALTLPGPAERHRPQLVPEVGRARRPDEERALGRRAGGQRLEARHQVAVVSDRPALEHPVDRAGSRTGRGPRCRRRAPPSGTASRTDRSSASEPDADSTGEAAERGVKRRAGSLLRCASSVCIRAFGSSFA